MENHETDQHDIHTDESHTHTTEVHSENHSDDSGQKSRSPFVRTVVVLGILVILFFISVSIVRFVPRAISSLGTASVYLSSIFSPGPKLEVSTDKKEVKSGEAFLLSWKNSEASSTGSYTFSFKCADGITMQYQSANGQRPIICETDFPLPQNSYAYPFTILSNKNLKVSVPLTVTFVNADTSKQKQIATVSIDVIAKNMPYSNTVSNPSYSTTTIQNNNYATSSLNTSTQYQSNPSKKGTASYGHSPDLAITLVQSGGVGQAGNLTKGVAYDGGRVLVMFRVSNVGDAPTGNWKLTATLPTRIQNERYYTSQVEPSLKPGDSYQMSLAFDNFDPSVGNTVINLSDPQDVNRSNNLLSIPIISSGAYNNNAGYNGGNYYNNYNYNYGSQSLIVRITDVGVMDRYTNQFYTSNVFRSSDKIAVRFTVTNSSNVASGPWSFSANIPSQTNSSYNSGTEPSIAPGQSTQFTIGFDNPNVGSDNIYINLNSGNYYNNGSYSSSDSRNIYVAY